MHPAKRPLVVSACLAGRACRYDGGANPRDCVAEIVERGLCVLVCPEVLGGLGIPRTPCEIRGNRVMAKDGRDCTDAYRLGASRALAMARDAGACVAVLKARSPSCGVGRIYDGTFSHALVDGDGIFAGMAREAGLLLFTEEDFPGLDALEERGLVGR